MLLKLYVLGNDAIPYAIRQILFGELLALCFLNQAFPIGIEQQL